MIAQHDSMGNSGEWGLKQGMAAIFSVLPFHQSIAIFLRIPRKYLNIEKIRGRI